MRFKIVNILLIIMVFIPVFSLGASGDIKLTLGSAKVIRMKNLKRIVIGDPEIAEVKKISDKELLVSGKAMGRTNLIIWNNKGRRRMFDITVMSDKVNKTMIRVDVQVMEINKSKDKDIGLAWEKLIGVEGQLKLVETNAPLKAIGLLERGKLDIMLKMLLTKGNAKILAKPKLMTLSGYKARFSSGGEIPVATLNSNGQVHIDWKKHGVNLDILPILVEKDNIKIDIKAEVSDVDYTHLIQGNPALKTRWASTTIQVQPGITAVIGGLLQETTQTNNHGIPLLADIPVLGYLFKSTRTIKKESELVIFVTPYIV